ncbi:MAG: response regulator transcription factor [Nitrospina sp.]|nr:response regulator transcription factor [Nitrospina sp.]MBT6717842.1 response regulator transcription factor [Nitrospina sp.]
MSKDSAFMVVFLVIISIISGLDIFFDLQEGASIGHISTEGIILSVALLGVFWIVRQNIQIKKDNKNLHQNLERLEQDTALWKAEAEKYLQGLGDAINKQMSHWSFTTAEKEVGLLMLKGFSFKEVASFRETSERTARQQSLEIYKKSGLSGRAEFSAFFLEDLLLPKSKDEKISFQD